MIWNSHIPFSSSIVLVKKKDGSWRMCGGYGETTKWTIKDKFLIPIMKELLNEFRGSIVFSTFPIIDKLLDELGG